MSFSRGHIVWGKIPGFPWWPAIVIDAKDCGRDDNVKEKSWLLWFGDHKVSQIPIAKINDFKENYIKHFQNQKGKKFNDAVKETLTALSDQCSGKFSKSSSLFDWAANGFKIQSHKAKKVTGLPKIASDALSKQEFQRVVIDSEDECDDVDHCAEDDSDKTEKLLHGVLKGTRDLEDICISCCDPYAIVRKEHLYFKGGVCNTCMRNVKFACKSPFGKPQDYCIICGQGGTMIFCSSSVCLRPFCELCINYLTPKGTFNKILRSSIWICYLCEPYSQNTLIRPRLPVLSSKNTLLPVCNKKNLINVISHSEAIVSVMKSIPHFVCQTAPGITVLDNGKLDEKYRAHMTKAGFRKLATDFVCGSYLEGPIKPEVTIEDVNRLSVEFHAFLYNLDNAMVSMDKVYFAFLSNAIISNYPVQDRFARILEVPPIAFKAKSISFYCWSNIPNCSSLNSIYQGKNLKSEKDFFMPIFELLSECFQIRK